MINRKTLLLLMLCVMIFACQTNKSDKNEPDSVKREMDKTKNVVGGWSEAVIDGEVEKAAEFALGEIQASSPIEEISDVQTQIVSGKNYDITFALENGEKWNVIVYRNLKNEYSLMKSAKLQR